MYEIFYLVIGLIIGIAITYYLLRKSLATHFQSKFEQWKVENDKRIRRTVLDQSRFVLKGRIGEQMAPLLPSFDYNPSDARFIGNPIDYLSLIHI